MMQTPMQRHLCVSVFLLVNPLELTHNADNYAETTMRFCFSAGPLEMPHNVGSCAETLKRFCFSAEPPGTAP